MQTKHYRVHFYYFVILICRPLHDSSVRDLMRIKNGDVERDWAAGGILFTKMSSIAEYRIEK